MGEPAMPSIPLQQACSELASSTFCLPPVNGEPQHGRAGPSHLTGHELTYPLTSQDQLVLFVPWHTPKSRGASAISNDRRHCRPFGLVPGLQGHRGTLPPQSHDDVNTDNLLDWTKEALIPLLSLATVGDGVQLLQLGLSFCVVRLPRMGELVEVVLGALEAFGNLAVVLLLEVDLVLSLLRLTKGCDAMTRQARKQGGKGSMSVILVSAARRSFPPGRRRGKRNRSGLHSPFSCFACARSSSLLASCRAETAFSWRLMACSSAFSAVDVRCGRFRQEVGHRTEGRLSATA